MVQAERPALLDEGAAASFSAARVGALAGAAFRKYLPVFYFRGCGRRPQEVTMNLFRTNALAINTNQAEASFGLVANADIHHQILRDRDASPCCSGKRRQMSMRPYPCSVVPVSPVSKQGGMCGTTTLGTTRPLWRTSCAGGPAARLWATLVLQRALSS